MTGKDESSHRWLGTMGNEMQGSGRRARDPHVSSESIVIVFSSSYSYRAKLSCVEQAVLLACTFMQGRSKLWYQGHPEL